MFADIEKYIRQMNRLQAAALTQLAGDFRKALRANMKGRQESMVKNQTG
jgi:hypothetical protein